MKSLKLFFVGFLALFLSSCQFDKSDSDEFEFGSNEKSVLEKLDFSISENDAAKNFVFTPEGVVEINGIAVDFTCDKYLKFHTSDKDFILLRDGLPMINDISYGYDDFYGMNLDIIRTVGQLANIYADFKKNKPSFQLSYSSIHYSPTDADYIYETVEYLLSQACFQDDCSSQTRKAVLKMALQNQTYKFGDYQTSFKARRSGIFLMASILVKEGYEKFLNTVHEDTDLQNALSMSIEDYRVDKKFSNLVSEYAYNYLVQK